MWFVPVKPAERQGGLVDHETRGFPVRQQTRRVNTIRAHLAGFAPVHARGIHDAGRLPALIAGAPEATRPVLDLLAGQLRETRARMKAATNRIEAARKGDPPARRPGDDPRDRRAFIERLRRNDTRDRPFPHEPRPCCMARFHAASAFERG